MKANSSTVLIDNFFNLISSLSRENKIKLIARLSNAIVNESPKDENTVDKFFGAFKSEKSAEEIINEIRESRKFDRKLETL
jgi:predicted metal-binding transcription factor (methanogenesis marker protein 9)